MGWKTDVCKNGGQVTVASANVRDVGGLTIATGHWQGARQQKDQAVVNAVWQPEEKIHFEHRVQHRSMKRRTGIIIIIFRDYTKQDFGEVSASWGWRQ